MKKLLMQSVALAAIMVPAAVMLPAAAYAQETTSTISGNVVSNGTAVAGAQVTLTHVPTGTVATATTNADGSFNASGLRPGGPYTVAVQAAGFDDYQATDINTAVGQVFQLPVELEHTGKAIVVTATRIRGAGNVSQGPANVLTAADISKVTSVNRDIRDLAERDPFATLDTGQSTGRQVSFAGVNPRFNRFTIDGVPVTDSFGLNPDALPSRRGPVPIESIAQFETKVAPYDIREGFFLGGVSNAILKSGTNKFHGTAFYSYSSDKLQGKQSKPYPVAGGITDPNGFVPIPKYNSKDFGATLSGPIIPDRIFFMVSGERVRASLPVAFGTTETNSGAPVAGVTDAILAQISTIAQTKYGVNAGGLLRLNGDKDDRLVGRLDFNISSKQRLAVTGIYTKDSILTAGSTSASTLATLSDDYVKPNKVVAGVAQLNSEWSPTFSTEARVLYKDYKSGQTPILANTAMATICTDAVSTGSATSCAPNSTVVVGPQGSSQANVLEVKTWEASFVTRTTLGNHSFRMLADMQNSNNYDLFINGAKGTYYFDSIAAFQAGTAGTVSYTNATSGNPNDAAAAFTYQTFTFGIQDDWKVNADLTLSVGVRYDLFGSNDRPINNPNFFAREGFSNRNMVSGRGLMQPRFGFNWKPMPRLSIRGGGGIFGGGTPDVYIANSFSSSGVQPATVTQNQCAAALTNVSLTVLPASCVTALGNASATSGSATSAIAPNFKIPSLYRATLSATYRPNFGGFLGDNWQFGADVLYAHAKDAVLITDRRNRPITGASALTPDGRQRYYDIVSVVNPVAGCNTPNTTICNDTQGDYVLGNTHKGQSLILTARAEKKWDFGLDVWAAFTYQNVKDQQAQPSSIASSIYNNGAYLDPNGGAYGHSNDEVRYSVRFDLSYDHAFFGDYKTKIDLFGQARIGSPYSYSMQDLSCCGSARSTVFGTVGTNTHYLFYVPTGPNDPKAQYADALTQNLLEGLITSTKLAKYRGQIAPRNAFNSKWFAKLDLHLEQEIPTFVGGSRISLYADAENVLNLINHKWGQTLRAAFNYTKSITQVSCVAAGANTCDHYLYTTTQTNYNNNVYDQFVNFNPGTSLYVIRVGARLTF